MNKAYFKRYASKGDIVSDTIIARGAWYYYKEDMTCFEERHMNRENPYPSIFFKVYLLKSDLNT